MGNLVYGKKGNKDNLFSNKHLAAFSRIFVGVVFIFSGFVKMVDPLGTNYKFIDYFNDAFHLPAFAVLALPLAFLMNIVEFVTGISLIFKIKAKIGSWLALLFMIFFTPLTFYLAIADPVHDCGCFGDAWVLSNWETFWKNIIILAFTIICFINKDKFVSKLSGIVETALATIVLIVSLGFEIYNYRHLPMVDFRPYKIGTYIPEGMIIPEGKEPPKYGFDYTLKHKETGEEKTMDSESYLAKKVWEDTNWEITETSEPYIVKDGYIPPIHDLRIEVIENNPEQNLEIGSDALDYIVNDKGYSLLMVSYDMKLADTELLRHAEQIYKFCKDKGISFYCLTATSSDDVERIKNEIGANYLCYNTDPITLKTIVRANPGYVLLKKGTVLMKWHNRDFPPIEKLNDAFKMAEQELAESKNN